MIFAYETQHINGLLFFIVDIWTDDISLKDNYREYECRKTYNHKVCKTSNHKVFFYSNFFYEIFFFFFYRIVYITIVKIGILKDMYMVNHCGMHMYHHYFLQLLKSIFFALKGTDVF